MKTLSATDVNFYKWSD